MPIIRKQLSETELQAPNTRYNPTTNQMEVTLDGGATWIPDPAGDPRENLALLEPVTGDPCPRAGGMVASIQSMIANINTFTTAGALATNLISYALLFSVVGTPVAVALAVADTAILYGSLVLVGSMTPAVYEDLLCIFNCFMPEDGIIDDDVWSAMRSEVDAQIGSGDVNTVVDLWRTLNGTVGITNAATIGQDPLADCSGCAACDWAFFYDAKASADGFTAIGGFGWNADGVTRNPTIGWVSGTNHRPGENDTLNSVGVGRLFAAMHVTKIRMYATQVKVPNVPVFTMQSGIYVEAGGSQPALVETADEINGYIEFNGSHTFDANGKNMYFLLPNQYRNDGVPAGGGSTISGIHIQGDGNPPTLGAGWVAVDLL